jgi:hypothetical protein
MTDRQPPTSSVGLRLSVAHTHACARMLLSFGRSAFKHQNSQPRHPSLTDARVRVEKGQATHVHDGRGNCSVDAAKPDGLAWKPTRYHAGTPSRIGTVLSHSTALELTRSHALWLGLGKASTGAMQGALATSSRRYEKRRLFGGCADYARSRGNRVHPSPSTAVHCCPLLSAAVLRHDEPH